jgi:hypothetical protein
MHLKQRVDHIHELANAIDRALADHYDGPIDVSAALGAFTAVAVDLIRSAPGPRQRELLDGWGEAVAYTRAQVIGLH